MTVIAWDGTTLAADRLSQNRDGHIRSITKIWKASGHLFAVCGQASLVLPLMKWFVAGAVAKDYPTLRDAERWSTMWVVTPDRKVFAFEDCPYPAEMDDLQFAAGCGGDFARAAMHLGKTAIEAVIIASELNANCGGGYDSLTLDGPDEPVSVRL